MKQLLAVLFLIPLIGFGQTISPTQYFDSTYDITNENMIPGYDSSLILSGAIHSFPPALYIHKVDLDGNLIAEKSIEAYTADMLFPSKLIGTKDSNYITAHTIIQSSFNKLVFNKWDQNLDTLWQKIYGFNEDMKIGSIVEAFDSSLYVSFGDDQDLYVSKLNYSGELQWSKKYTYSNNVSPSSLVEMLDSNICLMSRNNDGTYLTVIDTSGAEILTKEITDHSCHELEIDQNGNLYLLGENSMNNLVSIIKLDNSINHIDSKTISFVHFLDNSKLKLCSDTSILIGGSEFMHQFDGNFGILDTSLNILNAVSFYGEFRSFCVLFDEVYFTEQGPVYGLKAQLFGRHYTIDGLNQQSGCHYPSTANSAPTSTTLSNSTSNVSVISGIEIPIQIPIGTPLFGTDNSCISFFGSLDENELPNLSIYPNPSQGTFTIETEGGKIIESLEIHASDGQLVYTEENLKKSVAQIRLNSIPTGIYYIKAKVGSEFIFKKLVIGD